jgi:DNA repair protein RadD
VSLILRAYQARAFHEARRRIAAGCKRLLVCSPTGSGKTVLFAAIVMAAVAKRSHVLVLCPKRELVRQAWQKFVRAGLDPAIIGVIMAGVQAGPTKAILGGIESADDDMLWACMARRRPCAQVQIASIDSLRNRAKPKADLLIIDECHKVLAASHLKIAEEFPEAVHVGVTATPIRADGRALGSFFSEMIVVADYSELVASGHLVEPRCFTVPAEELPDLSRVRIKGSDFDPSELDNACNTPGLVGDAVAHWQRHGNNAPTFVFAVSIDHSKRLRDRFLEAGIPAAHIDGTTPIGERDGALRALREGTVKVLTNVDVLTEGVDLIAVKTIVLCRPTRSLRVFLQQVGRGSRPDPSGLPFTILDHCGSCLAFGLPHMITFVPEILNASKQKSGVTSAPARGCPQCFAVLPASMAVCPECGWEFVAVPREQIEETDGTLVEVVAPTVEQLVASWAKLAEDCTQKGYAPGWCYSEWSRLYPGTKPPAGCVPPSQEACAAVKNERAEILNGYLQQSIDRGMKVGWAKSSFKARTGQWPSLELCQRTQVADVIRGWLAGFAALMAVAARVSVRRVDAEAAVAEQTVVEQTVERSKPVAVVPVKVAPVTVAANDVELVDYLAS